MKKYLVIVCFLLLASVFVSIKHEEYANNSASNSGNQGLTVSPVNAPTADNKPQKTENSLKTWWERAYLFFGWPNGATVWALLLTMAVIVEQTAQTKRAAIASEESTASMAKSIKLQEIQFRQWVEIDDWENLTRHVQPNAAKAKVVVRFKVGNTTKFPLILREVTTKRMGFTDTFVPNTSVAPDGGYPADFSMDIEGEDLARFLKNDFAFGLAIDVIFEDVMKKNRPANFLYMVFCGPTRCDATEISNRHDAEVIRAISSEPTQNPN